MTKSVKIFLISLVLSFVFFGGINIFQGNLENFMYAQISLPFEQISTIQLPPKEKEIQKPPLDLSVKSAISVEVHPSGQEKKLLENNTDQALPIASLTKLMTAAVALEDPENYGFSKIITVSKNAVLQPENFGNLRIGDKLFVKDLLDIMLIESSNDAAFALAEQIGTENFVEKMNQKAIDLGMKNTYFINPSGLDIDNPTSTLSNLSTSEDLVKLTKYIISKHPLIFEISSLVSYEVFDAFDQFHHLAINTNGLLNLNSHVFGGKTGYTQEAGGCMILVLKDNKGNYIINVILGAISKDARFEEMKKLVIWAES